MPWSRPTLNQIQQRISQDLSGRLLNGKPLKARSVLGVLSYVLAGAFHLVYGFFVWLVKQANPATAAGSFLELWCAVWKVPRKQAAYAKGLVNIVNPERTLIAAGVMLKSQAGLSYAVSEDTSGNQVQVEALEPGAAYNLEAGAALTLVSPIAGVQSACESVFISDGVDQEKDEPLRGRLLAIIQNPPHGGNADDYVRWALQVPGVTRAWCYPLYAGPGTVGLTFVCDDSTDPIPSEAKAQEVYAHILGVCPVTARPGLLVFAPERLEVTVEVRLTPDTAVIRAAVGRELKDLFILEASAGKQIPLTHIAAAISRAPGEFDHLLVSPAGSIEPQQNQFPVLQEVLFAG